MFTKSAASLLLVCSASFALADDVLLTSGEVLHVTNVRSEGGRVLMDHPLLGHLDLPAAQVKEIKLGGTIAPAGFVPAPPPPPPVPPPAWKFKAALGINGESGTQRTQDILAAIDALYETPTDRWKFDAAYATAKTDGEQTKNQWYVTGLKDWMFVDSPWIAFATARYDRDKFQQWTKRISGGAGVGYKLIDQEDLKTRLRAGLNETREYDSNDDHWRLEGLFGVEASYKISASQSIEATSTYFPDFQNSGEYRVLSTAAWSIKLNDHGLSLKLGLEDEYDTHRTDPFKRQDFKYFLALLYEF